MSKYRYPRRKLKRRLLGQVTIEYMVLSLVVLAILAVAVTTLIQIQNSSSKALNNIVFRKSALDLHGTVEEVCALGEGNQREVFVSRSMEVEKNAKELKFKNDTIGEMSLGLICPIDIEVDNPLYGNVLVIHEGDKININNIQGG
ncbi:MAG: hypothetical protein QW590_03285 [Candidatus Bilamarchaeaceae archaeon]